MSCICRKLTTAPVSAPVFPWRSSTVVLDRLETRNDLSGALQDPIDRWKRVLEVGVLIKYSWLEVILGSWKQQLAEDMGWAFQKGVAGLLSSVLSIPMTKFDRGISGIDLDTASPKIKSLGDWSDKENKNAEDYIEKTLEKGLRSKYSMIDPKIHDVRFSCKPISYDLEYAHVIPIITRDVLAKDPSLLELYHDFHVIWHSGQLNEELREKWIRLKERTNGDNTFTLIVDISVNCLERFYISDKETGDIIQGSNNEQEVCHLVRFENTFQRDQKAPLGNWIISDWDDLLEGNVWHRKD